MDRESRDLAKFMQRSPRKSTESPRKGKERHKRSQRGMLKLDLVKDLGLSPTAINDSDDRCSANETSPNTDSNGGERSSTV
jgi:hypothetical protein